MRSPTVSRSVSAARSPRRRPLASSGYVKADYLSPRARPAEHVNRSCVRARGGDPPPPIDHTNAWPESNGGVHRAQDTCARWHSTRGMRPGRGGLSQHRLTSLVGGGLSLRYQSRAFMTNVYTSARTVMLPSLPARGACCWWPAGLCTVRVSADKETHHAGWALDGVASPNVARLRWASCMRRPRPPPRGARAGVRQS